MGDLEPITRNEKLWSGEDLTPVTRREMYIKHLYDETQVIPEYPVTREEMFILKAGEELHDVTIEQLTATENKTYSEEGVAYSPVIVNVPQTTLTTLDVTENGTYTAPSGTAYSEVDVDVPLPENAYLLKEIEDVEIATFTDGSDLPMPKLEVAIEAVQDLHGYDAPWVGGAGKNKLPSPAEQTINGVTLTHLSDGGIKLTGTPTANIYFDCFAGTFDSTSYVGYRFKVSYIGSSSGVSFRISGSNRASMQDLYDNSVIADNGSGLYFALRVAFDATIPSSGIIIYPMLLSSSETNYDFAPYSNICPISGWDEVNVTRCGENLFDKATITENKIINNTTGEETTSYGRFASDYIKVNPSTDYYASNVIKSAQWYCVFYYDKNKNYLSCGDLSSTGDTASGVVTTPSGCNYARLVGVTTYKDDVSFVVGNQPPTAYEPYNGHTYTIDLDGTRYGGKVDLVSGVMVVTHGYLKLTDTDYNWQSGSWASGYRYFTSNRITEALNNQTCQSSIYKKNAQLQEQGIAIDTAVNSNQIDVRTQHFSSLSSWKTYLASNPVDVRYELATPLTIQLTPTVVKSLRGKNNVWADTGNILDLSYLAKEE